MEENGIKKIIPAVLYERRISQYGGLRFLVRLGEVRQGGVRLEVRVQKTDVCKVG